MIIRRLRTKEDIGLRLHTVLTKASKALDIQQSIIVKQSGELEAFKQIEQERARAKAALVRVNNPDPNLIFQDPDSVLAAMQLERELTESRQAEAASKASGKQGTGKGKRTANTDRLATPQASYPLVLQQRAYEGVWKLQDTPFIDADGDSDVDM